MDQEFDKVRDEVGLVEVNTTAAREHVSEIERFIRVVKERARAVKADMPDEIVYLPKQVVIAMIYFIHRMLNATTAAKGISDRLSP